MKIIFMGTPDFSVGTLRATGQKPVMRVASGSDVSRISRRDEDKAMQPTPVKAAAMKTGNSGISSRRRSGRQRMCGRIKKVACRCYGCDCFWTDPSKVNSGNDKIWMHQCACLTASKVPWCSTDPVGESSTEKE